MVQKCVIHIVDTDDDLLQVTEERFQRIQTFSQQFAALDQYVASQDIIQLARRCCLLFSDKQYADVAPLYYHSRCYKYYVHQRLLDRAQAKV